MSKTERKSGWYWGKIILLPEIISKKKYVLEYISSSDNDGEPGFWQVYDEVRDDNEVIVLSARLEEPT